MLVVLWHQVGTMHELSGKRVEVKSATPRGSGPVTGRGGMLGDRRMLGGHGPPMGARGMGMMPGQMPPQYGMNPYNAVGYASPSPPSTPPPQPCSRSTPTTCQLSLVDECQSSVESSHRRLCTIQPCPSLVITMITSLPANARYPLGMS